MEHEGVKPGDWVGPSTVSRAICRAVLAGVPYLSKPLKGYLASDCIVRHSEILKLAEVSSGAPLSASFCPVLILIPIRVGMEEISLVHKITLQEMLANRQCVGVIGGRPKHALYFIGFQDEELIGLDPHCVRAIQNPSRSTINSYCCSEPRKISFGNIDPTMATGFLCETMQDFEEFCSFLADPKLSHMVNVVE